MYNNLRCIGIVSLLVCLVVCQQACKHETVIPETPVTYSGDIAPILAGSCQFSGCHGTQNPEELELLTYDDVKRIVKVGNPDNSKLYEVVTARSGEEAMPRSPYPTLSDRQKLLIKVWILQGALNN
jgi:hypothetical protein